jgi:hypothetical protein
MNEVVEKLNPGDAALSVRFYRRAVQNEEATSKEGRPIFHEVDYVEIFIPGDKTSVIDRPASDDDKTRFAKKYQAYQERQDQDALDGTPLAQWPGMNQAQVLELAHFGCKTVDQLAAMSDDTLHKLGAGYLDRRKAARIYLEEAAGRAPLEKMQAELSDRDKTIAGQSVQIESMEKAIAELQAKLSSPPKTEADGSAVHEKTPQRRLGRPLGRQRG